MTKAVPYSQAHPHSKWAKAERNAGPGTAFARRRAIAEQRTPVCIQCAENGFGEYTVDIIYGAAEPEADSSFEGPGARAKAEQRAEVLAKLCGCSWETNY